MRNPTVLAAKNCDFGRFVTARHNVHFKQTRFFERVFLFKEAWFWRVKGFGVAIALIYFVAVLLQSTQ